MKLTITLHLLFLLIMLHIQVIMIIALSGTREEDFRGLCSSNHRSEKDDKECGLLS